MKVKSLSSCLTRSSCPTCSDPIDCSLPGSSIHGIFQARVLEWGAIAFSESIPRMGHVYLFTAVSWALSQEIYVLSHILPKTLQERVLQMKKLKFREVS